MKKLLSLVLALVLALGMFAMSASADEAEAVTIRVFFGDTEKPDDELVQDELNKYLVPNYGVAADFVFFGDGEYGTKLPLLIASDEPMDVCFDAGWMDYIGRSRAGAYLDITDMLADHPALVEAIHPGLWNGVTVDGRIYAVPTYKELGEVGAVYVETSVLEDANIDASQIHTLAECEPILEALAQTDRYGFQINVGGWQENLVKLTYFDCVQGCDAAVVRKDEGETFVNYYDTDEFMDMCNLFYDWYNKGYIAEDVLTLEKYELKDADGNYNGKMGMAFNSYSPLAERNISLNSAGGNDVTKIFTGPITITNNASTGSVNAILAKTEHPEEAMTFMEAWNTDSVVKNFITFGVEGVHYEVVGENTIRQVANINDLYVNQNWRTGNQFIGYILENEAADKYEQYLAFNNAGVDSTVLGFNPITDEITDKLAAISGVTAEYVNMLTVGVLDPAEYVPTMRDELKAVGVDDVIAFYQTQFEAWKAVK